MLYYQNALQRCSGNRGGQPINCGLVEGYGCTLRISLPECMVPLQCIMLTSVQTQSNTCTHAYLKVYCGTSFLVIIFIMNEYDSLAVNWLAASIGPQWTEFSLYWESVPFGESWIDCASKSRFFSEMSWILTGVRWCNPLARTRKFWATESNSWKHYNLVLTACWFTV